MNSTTADPHQRVRMVQLLAEFEAADRAYDLAIENLLGSRLGSSEEQRWRAAVEQADQRFTVAAARLNRARAEAAGRMWLQVVA